MTPFRAVVVEVGTENGLRFFVFVSFSKERSSVGREGSARNGDRPCGGRGGVLSESPARRITSNKTSILGRY